MAPAWQRLISLNSNAGPFVDIYGVIYSRQIEAMEDESVTTQGVQVKSQMDNFATVNTFSFASEPIYIPNIHRMSEKGALISFPAQGQAGAFNYVPSPKIMSAQSNGSQGTLLRVIENA